MINNNSINNKSGNTIDAEAKWNNVVKLITAEGQNDEKLETVIKKGLNTEGLPDRYHIIYDSMWRVSFQNYKNIIKSIKDIKYEGDVRKILWKLPSFIPKLNEIEEELESYTAKIVDIKDGTLDEYDEIDKTIDSFKGQCKKCKDILNSFDQAMTSKKQVIDKKDAKQKWNNFIKNIESKDKEIQQLKKNFDVTCWFNKNLTNKNPYIEQYRKMQDYLNKYTKIMNDIKATPYHLINSTMLKEFCFNLNTLKDNLGELSKDLIEIKIQGGQLNKFESGTYVLNKNIDDITSAIRRIYKLCNQHSKKLKYFEDLTPIKLQVEEEKMLKKNEEQRDVIQNEFFKEGETINEISDQVKLPMNVENKLKKYEQQWNKIQNEFFEACKIINEISDEGIYYAGANIKKDREKIKKISNDDKTNGFYEKIGEIVTILKVITETHQELDGLKKEKLIIEKEDDIFANDKQYDISNDKQFQYLSYLQHLSSMLPTLEALIAYLNIKILNGGDIGSPYDFFSAQKCWLKDMLECIRNEIEIVEKIEKVSTAGNKKAFKELYQKLDENEKKMLKVKKILKDFVLEKAKQEGLDESYIGYSIKFALIKVSQLIDYMQIYRDKYIKPMQNEIQDIKPINNEQHKHKRGISNNKNISKKKEEPKKPNTGFDTEIAMALAQEEMDENKNKNVKKKLTEKEIKEQLAKVNKELEEQRAIFIDLNLALVELNNKKISKEQKISEEEIKKNHPHFFEPINATKSKEELKSKKKLVESIRKENSMLRKMQKESFDKKEKKLKIETKNIEQLTKKLKKLRELNNKFWSDRDSFIDVLGDIKEMSSKFDTEYEKQCETLTQQQTNIKVDKLVDKLINYQPKNIQDAQKIKQILEEKIEQAKKNSENMEKLFGTICEKYMQVRKEWAANKKQKEEKEKLQKEKEQLKDKNEIIVGKPQKVDKKQPEKQNKQEPGNDQTITVEEFNRIVEGEKQEAVNKLQERIMKGGTKTLKQEDLDGFALIKVLMDGLTDDDYLYNKRFQNLLTACKSVLPKGYNIKLISTETKRLTLEAFAVMLNMLTGKKINMLTDSNKKLDISFNYDENKEEEKFIEYIKKKKEEKEKLIPFDGNKGKEKEIKLIRKKDKEKKKDKDVIQWSKQVNIPNEQLKQIFNKQPKAIRNEILTKWQQLNRNIDTVSCTTAGCILI